MTMPGMSREAVIADNGVVLTGELNADSMLYPAAATRGAAASGQAPAAVLSEGRPGRAGLFGGASYTYADVVRS